MSREREQSKPAPAPQEGADDQAALRAAADRDLKAINLLFWSVLPEEAIGLGYLMYLEAELKPDDPYRARAVADLERRARLFARFEKNPRAQLYIGSLHQAALSYARGLHRANRTYDNARREAVAKKEAAKRTNVLTATRQGLMRGAMKLGLAGVAVFAAAMATVLKLNVHTPTNLSPWWTALALAGLVILVTIWHELATINRYERDIYQNYAKELHRARIRRVKRQKMELESAYATAAGAYWTVLCRDYPGGDGAPLKLLGLADQHLIEEEHELRQVQQESRVGLFKAIWSRVRRGKTR